MRGGSRRTRAEAPSRPEPGELGGFPSAPIRDSLGTPRQVGAVTPEIA